VLPRFDDEGHREALPVVVSLGWSGQYL